MKIINVLFIFLGFTFSLYAQKEWTLDECIAYAKKENAQVLQSDIQSQKAKIYHKQSKEDFLPDLNANVGQGMSFGRSLDDNNVYQNANVYTTSFAASTNLTLFKGMQMYNNVKMKSFDFKASLQDAQKQKDDVGLQIMSAYLSILYNKESLKLYQEQIDLTQQQIDQTNRLIEAGELSSGEILEIKAQLAQDEVNMVTAKTDFESSLLDLIQLMYLDQSMIEGFDIADDPGFFISDILAYSVDHIYENALEFLPGIKGSELRIQSDEVAIKIAQGAYSPQLGFNASYNNRYYTSDASANVPDFSDQMEQNSSFNLNFSLYIPIFNRMQVYNDVALSRLSLSVQEENLLTAKNNLRKTVQSAYVDAVMAKEKMDLSKSNVDASAESFRFQSEKYELGATTLFEYNSAKNTYSKAKLQETQAKFQYLFRTRILSYYNGDIVF